MLELFARVNELIHNIIINTRLTLYHYVLSCTCRFSPFVKTGTESYVLGAAVIRTNIPDSQKVTIVVSPEGI